jgi:hypothetical protein
MKKFIGSFLLLCLSLCLLFPGILRADNKEIEFKNKLAVAYSQDFSFNNPSYPKTVNDCHEISLLARDVGLIKIIFSNKDNMSYSSYVRNTYTDETLFLTRVSYAFAIDTILNDADFMTALNDEILIKYLDIEEQFFYDKCTTHLLDTNVTEVSEWVKVNK